MNTSLIDEERKTMVNQSRTHVGKTIINLASIQFPPMIKWHIFTADLLRILEPITFVATFRPLSRPASDYLYRLS